jgi:hypothetical protein
MKRRHLAMTAQQRQDFQASIEIALTTLVDYATHVMHRCGPWIVPEHDITNGREVS